MRRITTLSLVFCLVLHLLPTTALAQTAGDSATVTHVELDPAYLEESSVSLFSLSDENGGVSLAAGNHVRYIDRVDLPGYALDLYHTLEEGADGDGVKDILIDVTQAENSAGSYSIPVTTFSGSYSSDAQLNDLIYDNWDEAVAYIKAVLGAFDRDHPEVFWLRTSSATRVSYSYNAANRTYTETVYLVLQGNVNGSAFDIRYDDYTNPATLRSAIATRDTYVKNILSQMPATAVTDADKMLFFNKWLTENNEYNTVASGKSSGTEWDMAWECISALQGNAGSRGPVCEGYARAFQVLCAQEGIPCVLVSGRTYDVSTGSWNGHMWNYVQLEGNWYGVDVTWNDPVGSVSGKKSGYERDIYLFVGGNTVVSGSTFLANHPVENEIFDDSVAFVNGPVLSNTAYDRNHVHTYGAPTFDWAADGKSATATFICSANPTHVVQLSAQVTAAVKTAATCEEMGTATYTATVILGGVSYTNSKDVRNIPALGHDWGEWTVTKEPSETEPGEETRICQNDARHVERRGLYVITQSAAEWTRGSEEDLVFLSNADVSKFVSVMVDGVVVDPNAYTVEPGGTKITLKAAFLQTLSARKHSLTIVFTDGQATASFEVLAGDTNMPQRGDADLDGAVTPLDALLTLRVSVGLDSFTDLQMSVANLDHPENNDITPLDALIILRISVGLE